MHLKGLKLSKNSLPSDSANNSFDGCGPVISFPTILNNGDRRPALIDRLHRGCDAVGVGRVNVLPAESVTLIAVDIPVKSVTSRIKALPFTVEENVGQKIEDVHVAVCTDSTKNGGSILSAIVDKTVMNAQDTLLPIIPETLSIPVPMPSTEGGVTWATWREGPKVVVRVSDGTGFALRADMLKTVWSLAGQPSLVNFGETLPSELQAEEKSGDPPPPNPAELTVDLRQGDYAAPIPATTKFLTRWACLVLTGVFLHVATLYLETLLLENRAERELAKVVGALSKAGINVSSDVSLPTVVAATSPKVPPPEKATFLPMLEKLSAAFLEAEGSSEIWYLNYVGTDDQLKVDLRSNNMENLVSLQKVVRKAGFAVQSGTAVASDSGTQVELTITTRE